VSELHKEWKLEANKKTASGTVSELRKRRKLEVNETLLSEASQHSKK
jgi:hypothetical protein